MLFSVMFRPHTKCVEYANVVTYLVNIAVFEKCVNYSVTSCIWDEYFVLVVGTTMLNE